MTAHIVLAMPGRVVVYSDGATYDDDGIYRAPKSKVDVFPHMNCLLATRGSGVMGELLKIQIGCFYNSFSDVKIMLPTTLLGVATEAWRNGEPVNLEVILAGIPDYDGPAEIWKCFISGSSPLDRMEGSLEMHEIEGGFYATPGLTKEEYEAAGLPAKETTGTPNEFYVGYMQAMRDIPRHLDEKQDLIGCNVGAFVQKTVLEPGASGMAIIHRWPDVIGQPLNGVQPYVEEEEAA